MINTVDEHLYKQRMSISELSRRTSISRTLITDLVKGRKCSITLSTAIKLSKGLDCSAADLFPELKENTSR